MATIPTAAAGALILGEAEAGPSASYELVLAGGSGGHGGVGTKIIGSREFARYYRQASIVGCCLLLRRGAGGGDGSARLRSFSPHRVCFPSLLVLSRRLAQRGD